MICTRRFALSCMSYRSNFYGGLRCTEGETKAQMKGHRLIFELSHKPSDVLLSKLDLLPRNLKYVIEIKEEEFKSEFGKGIQKVVIDEMVARLVMVVPLYTKNGTILPLPCILDTGAPRMIYLGRESFNRIDKMKYIGYGAYFNKFLGEMHWGENKCINPTIDIIPERYEIFDEDGHSDVRVNVLSIVGRYQLGMLYKPLLAK